MLFSLMNTPVTFQRLMENCLWDLYLNWCIIYFDGIVIFPRTPQENLQSLKGVLEKAGTGWSQLEPSKHEFFHTKLQYFGHVVSLKVEYKLII